MLQEFDKHRVQVMVMCLANRTYRCITYKFVQKQNVLSC